MLDLLAAKVVVSIHALMRVRRYPAARKCLDELVSIHALMRVRQPESAVSVADLEFQSTHS